MRARWNGWHLVIAAMATLVVAAGCVPPKAAPTTGVTVVVGGTLRAPKAGGQVVIRNGRPVNAADIPVGNLPASALTETALATMLSAAPLRTSDPAVAPLRTSPIAQLPLRTSDAPPVLLSTVPLVDGRRWADLLIGTPLEGTPTQGLTLNQIVEAAATGTAPALAALTLADLDLTASPLRTSSVAAIALGPTTLDQLPAQDPPEADPFATTWCPFITGSGLDCADFSGASTIMSIDLAGAPLRTSPLRTSPLRTSDLSSAPLRTSPLRTSDLTASPLRTSPLRTSVLGAATLAAVALDSVPLRTSDLVPSPLRTSPLRTSSPALLATIVDCARVDCSATSTQTLGDAASLDPTAILPGATLGDWAAAFPETETARFVLGDLGSYGDATIGDIQPFVPATVTVGDAILAVIPHSALQWEAIDYDQLALPSLGATPPVTVTTRFTLKTGRPTATSAVRVELPAHTYYVAGHSLLVRRSGTPAYSLPEGGLEPRIEGGALVFDLPANAPAASYQLGFQVSADRGSSTPMRITTIGLAAGAAPVTVSAALPVVDGVAGQSYPQASLADGDLFLGVLGTAAEIDTFTVPVPPIAGAVTEVTVSHLDGDFDLVAFKPDGQSAPAGRPFRENGLKTPPVASSDPELSGARRVADPQTLRELQLVIDDPTRIAGISDRRGSSDERVELVSQPGEAGNYRFQVSGFNGATSPQPYLVVVRQTVTAGSGECTRPPPAAAPATAVGSIEDSTRALFLVNRQRLASTYGASAADAAIADVEALAASPSVDGAVVSIDASPAVRTAYATWDAAACDAGQANEVVSAVNRLVDDLLEPVDGDDAWKGLESVTIVGGDDIIPMARVEDGTASSNEAGYAAEVQEYAADGSAIGPSPLSAAMATRHVLTDDAYASWGPIAWRDSSLYLPDIGLGRLVEKPSEISAAVDAYMASPDGRLAASTALTTGYDFMSDGATSIDAALPTPTAAKQTLISDNWSGSDLTERLFGAGSSAEVQSLNAHFDHHQLLPAAGNAGGADALVTTADLAANQGRMAGRLVFSMGCHSGLSVPDGYLTGSATTTDEMVDPAPLPGETPAQTRARAARLDWAEAFANDGAVYIGNTGYGYGDTSAVAFSEHLMVRLASLLDGSVTAGQALSYAKQAYFGSLAAYSDYDQKVLMEATFYGLPFWGVGTSTPLPPTPGGVSTSIDPESGVPASPVSVHPAFTAATTPSGEVLTADGGAPTVLEGQPIVARTTVDATPSDPSLELHGFVITDLESSDTSGVRTAFGRPVIDLSTNEPADPVDGASFPSLLQTTSVVETPIGERQLVNLNVSQFRDGDGAPGVGTVRRFSSIEGQALYAPVSSGDGNAPTVVSAVGAVDGASIDFDIRATDDASIARVVVMYVSGSSWRSVDLAPGATVGGVQRWQGGATIPATPKIDWFAQVVDTAGNVSVTSDKAPGYDSVTEVVVDPGDDGEVIDGAVSTPGGVDVQTFTTTGQSVYLDVTSIHDLGGVGCGSSSLLTWELTGPGGAVFGPRSVWCDWDEGPLDLPAGTYTITVRGAGANTGEYTIIVWDVPPPDTETISIGDTVTGAIETPGVTDEWTFTSTGQAVYFDVTESHAPGGTGCDGSILALWDLEGPSGTVFGPNWVWCDWNQDTVVLPAGTYTLTVDGYQDDVVEYGFKLWGVPPPDVEAISIGAAASGAIETPGATDVFTFTSTGQWVYFDVTEMHGIGGNGCDGSHYPYWQLEGPSGPVFGLQGMWCDWDFDRTFLPAGSYTLTVDATQDDLMAYEFTIFDVSVPGGGTFTVGDAVTGAIETPGSTDVWTFTTAGQSVFLDVIALFDLGGSGCTSSTYPYWQLEGPSGVVFANSGWWCGWNSGVQVLPAGTYTLTVDAYSDDLVGYQFKVWNVPPPDHGTVTIGGPPVSGAIESPGVSDEWTFTSTGQEVTFHPLASHLVGGSGCENDAQMLWTLTGPSGEFVTNQWLYCGYDVGPLDLPAGTYTITVGDYWWWGWNWATQGLGQYQFSLSSP